MSTPRSSSSAPSPARRSSSACRSAASRARAGACEAALRAIATGILLFLLWDVLDGRRSSRSRRRSRRRRTGARFAGSRRCSRAASRVGLISLVYYDRWMKRGARRDDAPRPGRRLRRRVRARRWRRVAAPARWLALLIATGIGLHNFSEGLAIGQSAARGEIASRVVLIIGFGLHNATEGFGIVAPLSGERRARRAGRFLGAARPDRRRPDLRRHADRPGVDERGALGRLLRARGRLDPLRRDRAASNVNRALGVEDARHLVRASRAVPRFATEFVARSRRRLERSAARGSLPDPSLPAPTLGVRNASRVGYASVYPLVTARAVARPSPTRCRREWGRARSSRCRSAARRCAASSSGWRMRRPSGVKAGAGRAACSTSCRRRSSTWRCGWPSTTARRRRARWGSSRRGCGLGAESGSAAGGGLPGEAAPAALTPGARGRARPDRRRDRRGKGRFLLYGATGSGKTEVYLQACAAALERGLGAIVLVPEIALTPQALGRFQARFGERIARAALRPDRGRAARRARAHRRRGGARGGGRALGGVRAGARARADRGRRGARPVLQAGLRPAVRRSHGGGEARLARGGGRGLRQRDAAAGELGGARAAGARRPAVGRCRPCAWSICAARPATRFRRRCSRSSGRSGSTAARRSCSSTAAASRPRSTAAPAASRGAARTATSPSSLHDKACTVTTAASGSGSRALPGVRLRRARPDRRRHAAARARARGAAAGARADPARRGHEEARALAALDGSPRPTASFCSARR